MNFKNDGLTVGELSITVASLIIIGFIWMNIAKNKENQEISMVSDTSIEVINAKHQ